MINGIKPIIAKSTPTPKKPSTNGLSFDKAMDSLLVRYKKLMIIGVNLILKHLT